MNDSNSVNLTEKMNYRKNSVITEKFLYFIGCEFYRDLFFCNYKKNSVKLFFCKNTEKTL